MKLTLAKRENFNEQNIGKALFMTCILIIMIFLFKWSTDVGIDGDAPIQIETGEVCIDFFSTLGKDTSYTDAIAYKNNLHFKHAKYYGPSIEASAILIGKLIGFKEFHHINTIRKFLTVILSLITIYIIGIFIKDYFDNWYWGTFAMLAMFFSPTYIGLSFWQTKDAPVAAGFTITIYFLYKLFKNFPKTNYKDLIGLLLGTALTFSIRLQGLLLFVYLGLFGVLFILLNKETFKQIISITRFFLIIGIVMILGMTLGFMTYPIFWDKGYMFVYEAMTFLQNSPQKHPVLFEGALVDTSKLPYYYLPKMMLITIPFFAFFMFFVSLFYFTKNIGKKALFFDAFIFLFSFLFPIIYLVLKGTDLYNSWRHELFVYPSFIMFSLLGFILLVNSIEKKVLKYTFISIVIVLTLKTGYWSFKNAPFQYVYYNEFVGGTKGAFKKYDLDYLQISLEPTLQTFIKDHIGEKEGTVVSNTLLIHEMNLPNNNLKRQNLGFINKNHFKWDYGIFSPHFVPPSILKIGYPPKETVHSTKVDGVPICCIVERKKFDDFYGIKAYEKKQYKTAYKFLTKAYMDDENNYVIYPYLAQLSYSAKQYNNAGLIANKQLKIYPNDKNMRNLVKKLNQRNKKKTN